MTIVDLFAALKNDVRHSYCPLISLLTMWGAWSIKNGYDTMASPPCSSQTFEKGEFNPLPETGKPMQE